MWFVWDGKVRHGPYSETEICRRIAAGQWPLSVWVRPESRFVYRPVHWMLPQWCKEETQGQINLETADAAFPKEATRVGTMAEFEHQQMNISSLSRSPLYFEAEMGNEVEPFSASEDEKPSHDPPQRVEDVVSERAIIEDAKKLEIEERLKQYQRKLEQEQKRFEENQRRSAELPKASENAKAKSGAPVLQPASQEKLPDASRDEIDFLSSEMPARAAQAPRPVEAPRVAEAARPVEDPRPAQAPRPVEAPRVAEAPRPVEAPALAQQPAKFVSEFEIRSHSFIHSLEPLEIFSQPPAEDHFSESAEVVEKIPFSIPPSQVGSQNAFPQKNKSLNSRAAGAQALALAETKIAPSLKESSPAIQLQKTVVAAAAPPKSEDSRPMRLRRMRKEKLTNQKPLVKSEGSVNLLASSPLSQVKTRRVNPTAPRMRDRGYGSGFGWKNIFSLAWWRALDSYMRLVVVSTTVATLSLVLIVIMFVSRKNTRIVTVYQPPPASPDGNKSVREAPKNPAQNGVGSGSGSDSSSVVNDLNPGNDRKKKKRERTNVVEQAVGVESNPVSEQTRSNKPPPSVPPAKVKGESKQASGKNQRRQQRENRNSSVGFAARQEPKSQPQDPVKSLRAKMESAIFTSAKDIDNYLSVTPPSLRKKVNIGPVTIVSRPLPGCEPCRGKGRLPDGTIVDLSSVVPTPWNNTASARIIYVSGLVVRTKTYLVIINGMSSSPPR